MIRHVVMFSLKEQKEVAIKKRLIEEVIERLAKLQKDIPYIMSMELGTNIQPEELYDIVLTAEFINMEALKAYAIHPYHMEFLKWFKPYINQRAAVDYEIVKSAMKF